MIQRFLYCAILLVLAPVAARAEIFLTAEVVPTPGLEGFFTYNVTATSNVGKINVFGFGGHSLSGDNRGISGPLHQSLAGGVFDDLLPPELQGDPQFSPDTDSRFLFPSSDILAITPNKSDDYLGATFAFYGDAL
jgi:hypothetical protein